jgi:hypothetical protein
MLNMTAPNKMPLNCRCHLATLVLGGMLLAQSLCGCAHGRRHNVEGLGADRRLPKLTSLFAGPVSMLLTNTGGYQSEMTISWNETPPLKVSGQLFVSGGRIRIEAETDGSKRANTGGFGLIWDVAANRGYVISEPLQGYAPIEGTIRVTNITTGALPDQPEKIENHLADKAQVVVLESDGQMLHFQLARAQDLGNLPLQINSIDPANSYQLALTKIQPLTPSEELFLPPDGFTKYDSETALLAELTARQQDVFGAKSSPDNRQDTGFEVGGHSRQGGP